MSRYQGKPLNIYKSSKVTIEDQKVIVEGPKGQLFVNLPVDVKISKTENEIKFHLKKNNLGRVSMIGLAFNLVKNMMTGVNDGFKKELEINGVGYRCSIQGNQLKLQVGYSFDVHYPIPEGISIMEKGNILTIEGIDKQKVGDVADEIKRCRPVEPYKGKGIRYIGEHVIRKAGKSGK